MPPCHAIVAWPFCSGVDVSFFSPPLMQHHTWPIATKLCHTCSTQLKIIKFGQKLCAKPGNLAAQKHQNFGAISNNFTT